MSSEFKVDAAYASALKSMGLDCLEAVFAFEGGDNLGKSNLAKHRRRIRFKIANPPKTVFLKRYDNVPITAQIKNWVSHHRIASTMFYDLDASRQLADAGINTPRAICYGERWGLLFEKQSFIITEQIPGESLERLLPPCFANNKKNIKECRQFITHLAEFASKFHATGYRHRDFYFAHIFYHDGNFSLIDLQRASRPLLFSERYRVKDIAQLSYSARRKYFSHTDRLRFYFAYTGKRHLDQKDKSFIRAVLKKMSQMAGHDRKRGRAVPFEK